MKALPFIAAVLFPFAVVAAPPDVGPIDTNVVNVPDVAIVDTPVLDMDSMRVAVVSGRLGLPFVGSTGLATGRTLIHSVDLSIAAPANTECTLSVSIVISMDNVVVRSMRLLTVVAIDGTATANSYAYPFPIAAFADASSGEELEILFRTFGTGDENFCMGGGTVLFEDQ
jgi:hypothetical protein